MFLTNKKIVFAQKSKIEKSKYRVKFNRKDIVKIFQKYQNVSE